MGGCCKGGIMEGGREGGWLEVASWYFGCVSVCV